MSKKILVIAAHPDDEILGCGGTMARHSAFGDTVYVRILAEGITSRDATRNRPDRGSELSALEKSAREANALLGISDIRLFNFPDNRMDSIDLLDIVKTVETELNEIEPDIVYTHNATDLNVDHRIVHQAVLTALRPVPGLKTQTILFFEVPSSTDWMTPGSGALFTPNWFVDISGDNRGDNTFLRKKLDALRIYSSEMRPWPHSRSLEAVEHLAHWRGATVGFRAAESFMLGRCLVV